MIICHEYMILQYWLMVSTFFSLQDVDVLRHVISEAGKDPSEGLKVVDAIQRLGIDYLFEEEIEEILQNQYILFDHYSDKEHNEDFCDAALRFRLLRQHGYFVPAGTYTINSMLLMNQLINYLEGF